MSHFKQLSLQGKQNPPEKDMEAAVVYPGAHDVE